MVRKCFKGERNRGCNISKRNVSRDIEKEKKRKTEKDWMR